ncbi:MAG TPA: DUF6527 family protein, partial [Bryobacteraceae bacterium]|nr:DUF6527 family protein [Bryobacteraceae bacterium]
GNKVVTPIRPTDWKLIFDGKTISLDPSIGNWSFACRSHYWIRNNRIRWAAQWSEEQIRRGRTHDQSAKRSYFEIEDAKTKVPTRDPAPSETGKPKRRFWRKLKWWL